MTTSLRRAAAWAVSAVLLLVSFSAFAEDARSRAHAPYALLFGTVYGPDNRPEYAVKIKIRRADQKKPKWELVSDHQGEFAQRVPAGKADYIVSTDMKKQPSAEVTIHVDNDERKDFSIHLK